MSKLKYEDLYNPQSESGVIATLIHNPNFLYSTEQLDPTDFADTTNQCIYWALREIINSGINSIDDFTLTTKLSSNKAIENRMNNTNLNCIKDILELSEFACRNSVESYKDLVKDVIEYSAKRKLYQNAQKILSNCLSQDSNSTEIQGLLNRTIDEYSFSVLKNKELSPFKDKVEELWMKMTDRQNGVLVSTPFHIEEMNNFVALDDGELVVIGGYSKRGKSAFLLSCTVDLLRRGESVLVIDSELSDELYFLRLLSHISQVPFKIVKSGEGATEEQKKRIIQAKEWLKTVKLHHEYLPIFDKNEIASMFRRVNNSEKITKLVIDYFKADFAGDAFGVATNLTGLVNYCKNDIAGAYKIGVLGAIQTSKNGQVSFSSSAVTAVSALCWIDFKTPQEIAEDGIDCGNAKMNIQFNRNGAQMQPEEYISLQFDGDVITYKSPKRQHEKKAPY